ncbi:MAG: hypothetical protein IJ138_04880 [Clostridia bacterium]|nr:hypothetical protein [Clostridia bacterium]
MFTDIGAKVKGLAKTIFVILVIAVFVAAVAIIIMTSGEGMGFLIALLVVVVGILISWLSVLLLYAFGELVDNSTRIVSIMEGDSSFTPSPVSFHGQPLNGKYLSASKSGVARAITQYNGKIQCPFCGTWNTEDVCNNCGAKFIKSN